MSVKSHIITLDESNYKEIQSKQRERGLTGCIKSSDMLDEKKFEMVYLFVY